MKLKDIKPLHDQGFAIIWLRPKSKAPIESKWTTKTKKSWAELENSFEPNYNVGVRLGEASRLANGKYLCVIDCDVKSTKKNHLAEMEAKLKELGVDTASAPTVVSGRGNGSRHIYICSDSPFKPFKFAASTERVKVLMPSVQPSKRELSELTQEELDQGLRLRVAWEISIMGEGQQVVLPPSIHPDSGLEYRWEKPFKASHLFCLSSEKIKALAPVKNEVALKGEKFDYEFEDIDLDKVQVSDKIKGMIRDGTGVTDDSAALFMAAKALYSSGLSTNAILSILTNEEYHLGQVGYRHRQTQSAKNAARWVYDYTLLKAKNEISAARIFEENAEEFELAPLDGETAVIQAEELKKEMKFPDLTQEGKIRNTVKNTLHAVTAFVGNDVVGYNEFTNRVIFLKDTPYGGKAGRELRDVDDIKLKEWCFKTFNFEPSVNSCFEVHQMIMSRNKFHPVREWLRSLEWDGTERLPYWLEIGLGATGPEPYLNAVGTKVLVAAVKRIFEPGCKFDYMMVLEGKQGRGKSTTLAVLASPEWFTDSIGDIHQKDTIDNMIGKWIIEFGEIATIKKTEKEPMKAFISRQVDRIRMPYGRRAEDFPRQFIFIGSTNDSRYLQDETGNRRFWPVAIDQADLDWLKKYRDQLFAEAVVRCDLGEELYLSPEIEALAKIEQEDRFEVDEWEEPIAHLLHNQDRDFNPTTTEVFKAIGDNAFREPSDYDLRKVGKVLRRLGWERKKIKIKGVRVHRWRKLGA